jgi:hypothetical protein
LDAPQSDPQFNLIDCPAAGRDLKRDSDLAT